jgi:uncharacterized membrane protein
LPELEKIWPGDLALRHHPGRSEQRAIIRNILRNNHPGTALSGSGLVSAMAPGTAGAKPMTTLFAITYPTTGLCREALAKLGDLQRGAAIAIIDSAIVSRSKDGSVKLDQTVNITAAGAMSGAFWGSLIGMLFLSPLTGAAIGASAGAASGYTTDYGISDSFMQEMGKKLDADAATLFVMAAEMTADKVAEALAMNSGAVAYTSMPDDLETSFTGKFRRAAVKPEPELVRAVASMDG